jgi:hypothetical protein
VVLKDRRTDAGRVTGDELRRTTAVHAAWVLVSTAAWFGPLLAAGQVLLFGDAWNWRKVVVVSVVYGGGMALTEGWQARRPGAPGARLDRERGQLLRDRRYVPALLGVAAALVALVAATTETAAGGLWLYATAAGGGAVAAPVWVGRRLRVVEELRQQLGELRPSS